VFRNIFQRSQGETGSKSPTVLSGPRVARHSSGWSALQKSLKGETGLLVLDIGPTSPTNINFLTNMGQSVYMSDLVLEANKPEWVKKNEEGEQRVDVDGFLAHNLDFSDREFDVVLLWTTLDYLPEQLVAPVVQRLHSSMRLGGKVLALFHNKLNGDNTAYCRYHLTDTDAIEMQGSAPIPMQRVFTNRSIEKTFGSYSGYKFFLAKDNLYEVIITR
jgi:methyltransferase family protein